MARLILDTTVIVAAERRAAATAELIEDTDDVAIAAVTAAELLVGVELTTPERRPARERFVATILAVLPIEDYDLDVARVHAGLIAAVRRSGRPRGAHDLIIAATGATRDRIVVTSDASGFEELPGVSVRVAATT